MIREPPTELEEMRSLSPDEFEEYVSDLYEVMGYDTKKIQLTSDGGRDVVADKNDTRIVIQAKRFDKDNKVTPTDVRNYSSLLLEEDVDNIKLVTTSSLTNNAWSEASRKNGFDVIDGNELENLATRYQDSLENKLGSEENKNVQNDGPEKSGPSLPSVSEEVNLLSTRNQYRWRNVVSICVILFLMGLGGLFLSDMISFGGLTANLSLLLMGIAHVSSVYAIYKDLIIRTQKRRIVRRIVLFYIVFIISLFPFFGQIGYLALTGPST